MSYADLATLKTPKLGLPLLALHMIDVYIEIIAYIVVFVVNYNACLAYELIPHIVVVYLGMWFLKQLCICLYQIKNLCCVV